MDEVRLIEQDDPDHGPFCRVCGVSEKVLVFSDNGDAICPDCCDQAEHPDGRKGHKWTHDQWERDWICDHCGVPRECTEYAYRPGDD